MQSVEGVGAPLQGADVGGRFSTEGVALGYGYFGPSGRMVRGKSRCGRSGFRRTTVEFRRGCRTLGGVPQFNQVGKPPFGSVHLTDFPLSSGGNEDPIAL